ncbi:hypothetical protein EVAR_69427_1 [Eumeta japonica]|uniref:Uncharacterized protein n=1 Tax=Eumeta variegata TaxID=151549 RepID=A0A4C2A7L2_EUMVA|nr:hypothetical protein EVAR_69427_1 [Eumeta japonica]
MKLGAPGRSGHYLNYQSGRFHCPVPCTRRRGLGYRTSQRLGRRDLKENDAGTIRLAKGVLRRFGRLLRTNEGGLIKRMCIVNVCVNNIVKDRPRKTYQGQVVETELKHITFCSRTFAGGRILGRQKRRLQFVRPSVRPRRRHGRGPSSNAKRVIGRSTRSFRDPHKERMSKSPRARRKRFASGCDVTGSTARAGAEHLGRRIFSPFSSIVISIVARHSV